jgi:DNA segregation ATPase FtsK/SpoIIIE-like protein
MLVPPNNPAGELDDLFKKAVEVVIQYDRSSPALLQRRLSIGYARAARLMDQLEAAGVVGPPEGVKAREVLARSAKEILLKIKEPPGTPQTDAFEVPANYKVPTNIKFSKADNIPWGKQLSDVIKSNDFKDVKAQFSIPIGYDDKKELHTTSLAEVENLIITGNPQSKKEAWFDTILTTLLLKHSPMELRFILIDPYHYLDLYNEIPNLLDPVITEYARSVSALRWTIHEVERRMKLFAQKGVRNIDSYNEKPKIEALPRILIINRCDWTDVETTDGMTVLSTNGSRAGVNLFIVTNRMGENNLSMDVKANIPNRAVFMVTSAQDSKLAGVKEAEKLKEGELLFKLGNEDPQKLTTIYTPEINVKEVVGAVKQS